MIHPKLIPSEKRLMPYILQGLTYKEIAGLVFRSEKTVKSGANFIMHKYNVNTRAKLMALFINEGLK